MNIWVQRKEGGYMDLSKWNKCGIAKDEQLPDITGKEVYIGVDLSATLDLTSVAFLVPVGDENVVDATTVESQNEDSGGSDPESNDQCQPRSG